MENVENVIKRIIELEQSAQQVVAEGIGEQDGILAEGRDECSSLKANIEEMAEHKIEQLRLKSRREADDRVMRIYEDTALRMRLMEEAAEENQGIWEKEIINRIIGR